MPARRRPSRVYADRCRPPASPGFEIRQIRRWRLRSPGIAATWVSRRGLPLLLGREPHKAAFHLGPPSAVGLGLVPRDTDHGAVAGLELLLPRTRFGPTVSEPKLPALGRPEATVGITSRIHEFAVFVDRD